MRSIPGVSLGTYFAVGAQAANASVNTSGMRDLIYLVKNNRTRALQPRNISHPTLARMVSVADAPKFAAELAAPNRQSWLEMLGLPWDPTLKIVPIPSSSVTEDTINTDRWPALKLANALKEKAFAKVVPAVVNTEPSAPKTSGRRRSAEAIWKGYNVLRHPKPDTAVLLVDDVLTHGDSVSAMDRALGFPKKIGVIVVGLTDSQPVADCFATRRFRVEYDELDPFSKARWVNEG